MGFTLVELIMVMAVIAIMLFVATPRFSDFLFSDAADSAIQYLLVNISQLKAGAVRNQRDAVLHLDLGKQRSWVTDETTASEEDAQKAMENSTSLPENLRLLDVEFFGAGTVSQGVAEIHFYKKGYSDRAVIHLAGSGEKPISLIIEPFLASATMEEAYYSFKK